MSRQLTGLALYNRTAEQVAGSVIDRYSTSFSLACRLLGPRVRPHIRNVYALVRVADELVDGPGADAGMTKQQCRAVLDDLENEVYGAMTRGFSSNLVVHAFARTARACGIPRELIAPFFVAMRTDLQRTTHDAASHDEYVYGSAEVVGLMCLQVFVAAGAAVPPEPDKDLVEGARRLGAAFQDVNFLRDRAHDAHALGRDYLAMNRTALTRDDILDRIDEDLAAARAVIPELPADCRRAVTAAHDLFAALSRRLRRARGDDRVRVPGLVKLAIAVRAATGAPAGARA